MLALVAAGLAAASGFDGSTDSDDADPGSSFTVFKAMAERPCWTVAHLTAAYGCKVCNLRYVSVEM
jgi:hypothetical protein